MSTGSWRVDGSDTHVVVGVVVHATVVELDEPELFEGRSGT